MKRSIRIQAVTLLTLLTLSGCGGRSSAPEASSSTSPTEASQNGPQAPAPSKPVAPKRTQQERPKRAVAPVPAPKQEAATPSSSQPQTVAPAPKSVVVSSGTVLDVTVDQPLSSQANKQGDRFDASLASPIVVANSVIIPTGAKISGTVTAAQSAGRATGSASLGLSLDSVVVKGVTYNIRTSAVEQVGGGRGKRTGIGAAVGAAAGAIIGAIAGGKKGAAIGAGAGAGAGTVGAVLTGNRDIEIPAETHLKFTLSEPVAINSEVD
jgi:hypothetical protein